MSQDPRTTYPVDDIGPWINVGSAGAPPFLNSWADVGAGFFPPSFRFDRRRGVVEVRGSIDSGTIGTFAWLMPAELHPPEDTFIPCIVQHSSEPGGVAGVVSIRNNGNVATDEPTGVTSPTVTFTGSYPLAPSAR